MGALVLLAAVHASPVEKEEEDKSGWGWQPTTMAPGWGSGARKSFYQITLSYAYQLAQKLIVNLLLLTLFYCSERFWRQRSVWSSDINPKYGW